MNKAPTYGFEKHVGAKTTVRFSYGASCSRGPSDFITHVVCTQFTRPTGTIRTGGGTGTENSDLDEPDSSIKRIFLWHRVDQQAHFERYPAWKASYEAEVASVARPAAAAAVAFAARVSWDGAEAAPLVNKGSRRFNPGGTRIHSVPAHRRQTARAGGRRAPRGIPYARGSGAPRRREGWAGLARRRGEHERAARGPDDAKRQTPQAKLGY